MDKRSLAPYEYTIINMSLFTNDLLNARQKAEAFGFGSATGREKFQV
jgi:hypothetical protein